MEIKKKTLRRDEWPNDEHKKTLINREIIHERQALVGLIWWTSGVKPVLVSNKTLRIVDEDYTWLSIAIEGESYWITVMYDEHDEFIEAYFDLSRKNVLDGDNPYLYDMFIDIIISRDGRVTILDEDELDMAYEEKLFSKDEYNHIKMVTKELYDYIVNNKESMLTFFKQKQHILKMKIKENML